MTKEELNQYQALKKERKQLKQIIEDLETQLYGPKVQRLTGMPGGRSGDAGEIKDGKLDELEQLRQELLINREQCACAMLAIVRVIRSVKDPTKRTLLRHRYINGMSWEQICVAMNYSWRQMHRLHASALRELEGGEHNENKTDN